MTQKQRFAQCTGVRRLVYRYSVFLLVLGLGATLLTSVLVRAADADLDPSFSSDGIVTTDRSEFDQIHDIVIQPDGKIVAAGVSGVFPVLPFLGVASLDMMVARYNIDGSLDSTFDSGGIVTTDFGANDNALGVALQADGKIVIAGRATINNELRVGIVRYNTNGSLDTTFGNGGSVITSIDCSSDGTSVEIQSDGKIVVTGTSVFSGVPVFTVARYNTDGSLDNTFDGDGLAQAPPAGFQVPWGMAIQADGKIVVAGESIGDQTDDFCLARFNSDGSVDGTFDGDGIVLTDFDEAFDSARDVVIQPDGKIVAAGSSQGIVALARYNTDGSLDTSFDGDGRVVGTPDSDQRHINALALRSDGKIVAAGAGVDSGIEVMAVARYNSDGSLDATFGSSGIVTTSIGTDAVATAIALQTDGRIVAGGYGNLTVDFNTIHWLSDLALVRYGTADGANNPPNVTIIGPTNGSIFAVNMPVNFSGTFTDDAGDTHTANWTFESITQPGTVVEPSNSTPGSANTTYTFTEAGVYKVALTVIDNGNLSGTATTVNGLQALVVIYDPNGGWVTGGGWINSPAGAFTPIPTLTGAATFGFVSRYQNGASVPTGTTEFQFKAGNLNFKSTSYEWLVISGGKKAQYKGVGTINGSGNFRFMLTVIDGDQHGSSGVDKLRIRIWSDSNGLVYDNHLNAPDSDDPTTVLGGGSIVIHH